MYGCQYYSLEIKFSQYDRRCYSSGTADTNYYYKAPRRVCTKCKCAVLREGIENITTVEYDEYTGHGSAYELLFFFFFGSDTCNNILKLSFSIYAYGNS